MNHQNIVTRALITGVLAATALAGCTMKSQEAPSLTGPSEFGTSISVTVSPDTIFQDGASQSLVTITARDQNGNPLRNLSVRTEILFGGVPVDFGSLSARSAVTGADGRATLTYTAPSSPGGPSVDNQTTVSIAVTPLGTDFANAVPRIATIRLVPTGVVVPPVGMQPAFTFSPTTPTDNQLVLFDASSSTASPTNPIASYAWDFGDGSRGNGVSATHSYGTPGTYVVTLTVSDGFNRTASASQSINVGGGATPSALFVVSPATSRIGEVVNFNASASRPAPGRTIRTYDWDFGDGETKTTSGPITSHDYQAAGSFTVTLVVTDDAGRVATATGSATITTDAPTADFTSSQVPPLATHTISFNSSGSSAIAGRTITGFRWDFGDGTTSTAATPTHAFPAAGTFNVTLTVTDSAGKTGSVTKSVTVS